MSNPAKNPNVPAIAQPMANLGSLVNVAQTLKQAVDSLGGANGKPTDRAVTFNDLIALGLITPQLTKL